MYGSAWLVVGGVIALGAIGIGFLFAFWPAGILIILIAILTLVLAVTGKIGQMATRKEPGEGGGEPTQGAAPPGSTPEARRSGGEPRSGEGS